VQTRRIGASSTDKRAACRFNFVDSFVALNGALLVNAAILILAASVFFKRGIVVTQIQQAQVLLAPLLGATAAGILFSVALLAAGQSSTLTGTMAGQIVMEGFLNFRMRPWLRRLITRMLAVIPAALTIYIAGEHGTYRLLILSLELPFAVIPLIHFTNDRQRMGAFANKLWVQSLAWLTAAVIVGLNLRLAIMAIGDWFAIAGPYRILLWLTVVPVCVGLAALLLWVSFEPLLSRWVRRFGRAPVTLPEPAPASLAEPVYKRILVPLDHTDLDRTAVGHAAALARSHGAKLFFLHVEEDVTSQVYGSLSSTAEVEAGEKYLERIAQALRADSIDVETVVSHSASPTREIVRYARQVQPDLLIMGAHGHRRWKDLIFGNTINPVRHDLQVPILIVRAG
ncbi:MAG: divalent metal cation transporter, partial [Acidobacteria bacterium]|nr:divalent metal cation transporter [Acidobacteriota bacterium]